MASIQSFVITDTGKKNVPNCPTFTIAAQVFDDQGGLVADFTGGNVLDFPSVAATLTAQQQVWLEQLVARWLVRAKAGLLNPLTGD